MFAGEEVRLVSVLLFLRGPSVARSRRQVTVHRVSSLSLEGVASSVLAQTKLVSPPFDRPRSELTYCVVLMFTNI